MTPIPEPNYEAVPSQVQRSIAFTMAVTGQDLKVLAYQTDDFVTQALMYDERTRKHVVAWTDGLHGGYDEFDDYVATLQFFCEQATERAAEMQR